MCVKLSGQVKGSGGKLSSLSSLYPFAVPSLTDQQGGSMESSVFLEQERVGAGEESGWERSAEWLSGVWQASDHWR